MKVKIENIGCDETTKCIMEINEVELEFLKRFREENNKNAVYGCYPTIEFEEVQT